MCWNVDFNIPPSGLSGLFFTLAAQYSCLALALCAAQSCFNKKGALSIHTDGLFC